MATHINVSGSKLIIGRFTVLPNEKMPAVPLTLEENMALKSFIEKGFFQSKEEKKAAPKVAEAPAQPAMASFAAAPAPAAEVKEEAPAEEPVKVTTTRKSRAKAAESTEEVSE